MCQLPTWASQIKMIYYVHNMRHGWAQWSASLLKKVNNQLPNMQIHYQLWKAFSNSHWLITQTEGKKINGVLLECTANDFQIPTKWCKQEQDQIWQQTSHAAHYWGYECIAKWSIGRPGTLMNAQILQGGNMTKHSSFTKKIHFVDWQVSKAKVFKVKS